MYCFRKPLQRSTLINKSYMKNNISIFFRVCERLFDELVKELLLANFTIVSASYEVHNGRKVCKRKAHLRRRKR